MSCHLTFGLVILLGLPGEDPKLEKMIVQAAEIKSDVEGGELRLALTPEGGAVFVANDKDGHIWHYDTATKKLRQRIETPLKHVRSLQVSPNGAMLAAGGDGLIVFDIANKKTVFHHKHGQLDSVAFSSSNKAVAFGTVDKMVNVLTLPDGKEWRSFADSRGPVMSVAISPNGNEVAAGGIDQAVRIWDLNKGEEKQKIVNLISVTSALAYSEDGNYLTFSGVQSIGPVIDPLKPDALNEIKVWNLNKNKAYSTITADMTRIRALFVAQDAKYVVAASENGIAFVWQRIQGKAEYSVIWRKEQSRALAVSRGFQKMVTATKDGSLSLWELRLPK